MADDTLVDKTSYERKKANGIKSKMKQFFIADSARASDVAVSAVDWETAYTSGW